jgi:pilus assembly protein CpaB
MSPKSIILLAMALGCGLVAAVGINQIMARPTDQAETVQIVVAKREIQKGEPFRPDDIRLQDWPKETVPEGALDSVEKLVDKRSRGMIYPGEPIIDKKLIGKGEGTRLTVEVPAGMKAISVKVDNESGLAGMVLPGDDVDVLLHAEANPSKQIFETSTSTIETNMKVLAVDDQMYGPDGKENSISAKTVTLLATPKQAARISLACEVGNVRLVLRSGKESPETTEDIVKVSPNDLFTNSTSSEPGSSGDAVNLPPVTAEVPNIDAGKQFAAGVDGLHSILKDLQNARDQQFVPEKEKPFYVVLIEGSESREIEFDPNASKSRKGPGLASLKSAAGTGATSPAPGEVKEPTAEEEPSSDKMKTIETLFKPEARRGGANTSLVQ